MVRFLYDSALIIVFFGLVLFQKVDWEWRIDFPQGSRGTLPQPPLRCVEIVLPPPSLDDGWLVKGVQPDTRPASLLQGAEADLYLVTGYAVGDDHTPGDMTADGRKVRPRITAACRLPLGTMIYIEGLGPRVCEDRGTGPLGVENWIDVAFETPEEAIEFGKQWLAVVVIK